MKLFFLFVFLFVIQYFVFSQDTAYARSVLLKLGSNNFYGRGYNEGGIDSAALFIKNEFITNQLKPIENTFVQQFEVPVNIFSEIKVFFDNEELIAGYDYLPDIHSNSTKGIFACVTIDEKIRQNNKKLKKLIPKIKGKVLFLAQQGVKDKNIIKWYENIATTNPYLADGIVSLDSNKLIHNISQYKAQYNHFFIQTTKHSIPQKPIKSVKVEIDKSFIPNYKVKNVCAYLQGREYPDSFLVITAHYDHLGMLGNTIFRGGNDNASGVAMMLDLAKKLKNQSFRPRFSILFLAFAGEEIGICGSKFFVENPLIDLKRIKFLINLDMIGTGADGIGVVNGEVFEKDFERLKSINQKNHFISEVHKRGKSCNSDHCPFFINGVPSFFIYSIGDEYLEYHNPNDKPEMVPLTAYNGLFKLLESFLYEF